MSSTYKLEALGQDIESGIIDVSKLEPDTDIDRELRVEGEYDKKKRVYIITVNDREYAYGDKHSRNSDYYRLLNAVQRAKKNNQQE